MKKLLDKANALATLDYATDPEAACLTLAVDFAHDVAKHIRAGSLDSAIAALRLSARFTDKYEVARRKRRFSLHEEASK